MKTAAERFRTDRLTPALTLDLLLKFYLVLISCAAKPMCRYVSTDLGKAWFILRRFRVCNKILELNFTDFNEMK